MLKNKELMMEIANAITIKHLILKRWHANLTLVNKPLVSRGYGVFWARASSFVNILLYLVIIVGIVMVKFCWTFSTKNNKEHNKKLKKTG